MRTLIISLIILFSTLCSLAEVTYPDGDKPKLNPQIFSKDFISTKELNEFRMTMSPDSKSFYYSIFDAEYKGYRILTTELSNGIWSVPSELSYTKLGDLEPFLSTDSNRFYFSSSRPPAKNRSDANIWLKEKKNDIWQTAKMMPFSTKDSEWVASETLKGNIYFARFDQNDVADIYVYSTADKSYPKGRKLDTISLKDSSEYEPYIDPNERFILFSSNRKSAYGKLDVYISLNVNGHWSKPINLGKQINNGEAIYSPYVSPDSQYLFFNRKGDLYWVNFQLLLKSLNISLNNE